MRTLFAILVLSISLLAQTAPAGHGILGNPEKFADAHLAAVDRAVVLTDQQKPKVRAIFVTEATKLGTLFTDATISDDQRQRSLQSLHLTTLHLVAKELTPEQQKKFFNFMPEASPRPGVVQN
jgi:hypothetical protein